ncbi:mediator of RNA polymerase II transcription subunit 17 [Daktulosphaira vitifoliae]|uniref:mediator of RNA polymerase II transcription subunit 17 n=1 Tax=Daktulosphaira vitifoliae TaxID=58002 RepID=UPI0021AAF7E1|nr:mediator of RNA polymerase II transcription subunit 17 [Daktulosphaira vitifoliae]XP_050542337.1 mediator of RNA polymerase II transcription subunit 17 [Daktulosphaira vitifoliae]XP_050542340.1 mediator of RNA polymerase II transcription subunit 17 [Daktulosphaira vitifoliae]
MAYSTSVNISIETPAENIIQEISYDGQEVYQPPLSMSDNLSKLAQRIDFSKVDQDDDNQPEAEIKSENDTKEQPLNASASGWIDSVISKLKRAATEICVISDVLAITKEKRYMMLDPIQNELIETKPMAQIYLRKKALASASNIIMSAVDRLRSSQNEFLRNRTTPDFHIELLRLRQNWRLKKVSTAIIGDLSYKTAGSKFGQSGMFEVTKAEDDTHQNLAGSNGSPSSSPVQTAAVVKSPSALRVTIPAELQGVSYIMVLCQKDQENIFNTSFNLLGSAPATPNPDMHWQQKLEAAQNVLFCKELFNQLAREAVQLQATIPHMVVGNQITATVFPGIQLIIGLCHSSTGGNSNGVLPPKTDHDHVLEHSLHQLLREVHHKNTHQPFPHPSSGPLGPSKRRAVAGPNAADRFDLLEMSKSQTLLEQIIEQAQHFFMRLRTEYVLDTLSKEVKDPTIISHWNSLNSPTQSCVKITIVSHGFDCICRTSLVIHVMKKSLKCICRDGRVMYLSYEPQELRDLIFCQVYQHQIAGVQSIAKTHGWQFLASSSHLGLGPVEPMGNASSCLLASPIGDRLISVKCEPQGNVSVSIAHSPKKDFFGGQLVKERKWENLGGSFKNVRWDKMEGKNFLNKIELLMASLTNST